MPIKFETHSDEETRAIILHVSIPIEQLMESKIMTELNGHPTPVELLKVLLEEAIKQEENKNGKS